MMDSVGELIHSKTSLQSILRRTTVIAEEREQNDKRRTVHQHVREEKTEKTQAAKRLVTQGVS